MFSRLMSFLSRPPASPSTCASGRWGRSLWAGLSCSAPSPGKLGLGPDGRRPLSRRLPRPAEYAPHVRSPVRASGSVSTLRSRTIGVPMPLSRRRTWSASGLWVRAGQVPMEGMGETEPYEGARWPEASLGGSRSCPTPSRAPRLAQSMGTASWADETSLASVSRGSVAREPPKPPRVGRAPGL